MMMRKADIGMIGLGVMGENLAFNLESKGFTVACFDRFPETVNGLITGRAKGKNLIGCTSVEDMVSNLKKPRMIMMMIQAGKPIDDVIEKLIPLLDKGDIIIDGGNSHFPDTIRRTKYVEGKGLLFIGTGVSGGEEGALHGPSLMPGGSKAAWDFIKPIFQAIAAKVDGNVPCCNWIGSDGAGHFVKMVHNGIEYGDMQLICETYQIMKDLLGMNADEMRDVFVEWNKGELDSYLIEITGNILGMKDSDGTPLVDKILDAAGQKGTGKWTSNAALDLGVPLTLISEAVFARSLSAFKEDRVAASKLLHGPELLLKGNKQEFIGFLKDALYVAKIISYAQGFSLLKEASKEYQWDFHYGEIALLWKGGCIIRSAFLGKINDAFQINPLLQNLLLDPFFRKTIENRHQGFRIVCAEAIMNGIPMPAFVAALSYLDGYRTARLPANLLQAQRDYFGAHLYERTDKPRGEFFHTNWTGHGGNTVSTVYKA